MTIDSYLLEISNQTQKILDELFHLNSKKLSHEDAEKEHERMTLLVQQFNVDMGFDNKENYAQKNRISYLLRARYYPSTNEHANKLYILRMLQLLKQTHLLTNQNIEQVLNHPDHIATYSALEKVNKYATLTQNRFDQTLSSNITNLEAGFSTLRWNRRYPKGKPIVDKGGTRILTAAFIGLACFVTAVPFFASLPFTIPVIVGIWFGTFIVGTGIVSQTAINIQKVFRESRFPRAASVDYMLAHNEPTNLVDSFAELRFTPAAKHRGLLLKTQYPKDLANILNLLHRSTLLTDKKIHQLGLAAERNVNFSHLNAILNKFQIIKISQLDYEKMAKFATILSDDAIAAILHRIPNMYAGPFGFERDKNRLRGYNCFKTMIQLCIDANDNNQTAINAIKEYLETLTPPGKAHTTLLKTYDLQTGVTHAFGNTNPGKAFGLFADQNNPNCNVETKIVEHITCEPNNTSKPQNKQK